MRFYNRQHTYYCGIDLHVKTMVRTTGTCSAPARVRLFSSATVMPQPNRRAQSLEQFGRRSCGDRWRVP